ncbi:MAG: AAA family ATPase [Anaerolineae bacterium]|nr:AAA family ATPase [Anaerolineae bacterium]
MLKPQELLHLFGPYLPTDRFRTILRAEDLPAEQHGAAMLVDMSGFSEMTMQLVTQFGSQRAGDELKRRLNPILEAIAGQVFQYGGSVIHFAGDGFTAWFDDNFTQSASPPNTPIPGVVRALAAGREMQGLMRLLRGLRLKVGIAAGVGKRYVVGRAEYGLMDVLAGPAAVASVSLTGEMTPDQVLLHANSLASVPMSEIKATMTESGHAIVHEISDALATAARQYRWSAWQPESDIEQIVETLRPFIPPTLREQVEHGFGNYVGELRHALPMFIRFAQSVGEGNTEQDGLNQYVTTVQTVLNELGGRLVSVEVGDKGHTIFVVFGASVTYGDDAVRAIMSAFRLRDIGSAIPTIQAQSFGISRGLLYSGVVGGEVRHEYSTIGDETNIAARLMNAAADGQILTTSAVRKEARKRVAFQELPSIPIKGRSEPLPIAEPKTLRKLVSRRMHTGIMVGRQAEMTQFRKLLSDVTSGYPQILRIEGHAGIGKSRFLLEAARYAEGHGYRVCGGYCSSTGRNLPYFAWHDLLVSLLRLNLNDSTEAAIRQLTAVVETLNPEWLPRLPLLNDILQISIPETTLTTNYDERGRSQAVMTLVTDLILETAHHDPLLLSIEDTQWLDEVSESLAVDLARRLMMEAVPVMFILIHRSISEVDHPLTILRTLDDLPIHTRLGINELSEAEVHGLIEQYLQAAASLELSQFAYERTQGNPFFIQELLDTLIETKIIMTSGAKVYINLPLAEVNLPQTIQGLIQARIDRLEELDKLVLKVAAVIGRDFQIAVLRESLPVPMQPSELHDRIQVLVRRDFITPISEGNAQYYQFKRVVAQEVAYQTVPFSQRRQLHQAVATALQHFDPDAVESLAYQYAQAGDDANSQHFLLLAGQKAFREYAPQSALVYFSQAYDLTRNDETRAAIIISQLEVLERIGDARGIEQQVVLLRRLADRNQRQDWLTLVHLYQAHADIQTSAWQAAIESAQVAADFAMQLEDAHLAWEAYRLIRKGYRSLDQHEDARALGAGFQQIVNDLNDPRVGIQWMLMQLEDRLAIGFEQETPESTLTVATYVLQQAFPLKDLALEADCFMILASLHEANNDLTAALGALNKQIARLRQLGDRRNEGLALIHIGSVLVGLGEFREGNRHLMEAYRLMRQINDRAGEATSLVYLGVIAEHDRAYDEALGYFNRGLVIQKSLSAFADSAMTLFHMGNCYIAQGDFDDALSMFIQARSIVRSQERFDRVAEIECGLAEIALKRGEFERAESYVRAHYARLVDARISGCLQPGLMFWRAIHVLQAEGEAAEENKLRLAFRRWMDATLAKMTDVTWQQSFVTIWYHAALLTDASVDSTSMAEVE